MMIVFEKINYIKINIDTFTFTLNFQEIKNY